MTEIKGRAFQRIQNHLYRAAGHGEIEKFWKNHDFQRFLMIFIDFHCMLPAANLLPAANPPLYSLKYYFHSMNHEQSTPIHPESAEGARRNQKFHENPHFPVRPPPPQADLDSILEPALLISPRRWWRQPSRTRHRSIPRMKLLNQGSSILFRARESP